MSIKKILVLTVGTLALVGLVFFSRLAGIDDLFYSLNFRSPSAPVSDSVAIVGVDSKSVERIGGWPWPRSTLAALFDRIEAAGPRAVAPDLLFPPRPDDSLGNDSLARVFARMRALVLPFKVEGFADNPSAAVAVPPEAYRHRFMLLSNKNGLGSASFFSAGRIGMPDTLFARYARYGGFLNVSTSKANQKMREIIHVMMIGGEYYPSFGLSAAAAFLGTTPEQMRLDGRPAAWLGDRELPLSGYAGSAFVNFRGRAGAVATISAADLVDGSADLSRLRNRLVFVGITEPGIVADFLVTPVGSHYPGVEVWATSAMDIIHGTWVRYGGGPLALLNWLLVLAVFPGLALVVSRKRRRLAIVAGAVTAVLSVALGFLLYKTTNYFWNPAGHALAWVFSLLWIAAQKVDPSLAGATAVSFESHDGSIDVAPPPPSADERQGAVPDADAAKHVAEKLRTETGAAEQEIADQVCALCNGRIVRLLGSGGMADVFLVWNPRLEVYRAVKVLKPGQPQRLLTRFETEIRICSNLSHPNIVQSFGVGDWYGLPYLEMEYINGTSMERVLPKLGKLLPEEAAAIGILVCRALQYAHSREMTIYGLSYHGVIHRDLKPANIMISRGGRVKLTDFGIARPTEVGLHTVDQGTIIGTLPYLAPEQAEGKQITARADLYALGVTLYELLTGQRAFAQQEITALLSAKATGTIKPLSSWEAIPPQLSTVVSKAMTQDPARRYESAAAMSQELERVFRHTTRKDGVAVLRDLTGRIWSDPA